MYINGHNDLDSHTSRDFTEFISLSGYDPIKLREFSLEDLPVVKEIMQRIILLCVFDIQERRICRRTSSTKYWKVWKKNVKLLRFNNHLIHTNDIDSFFKCLLWYWFFLQVLSSVFYLLHFLQTIWVSQQTSSEMQGSSETYLSKKSLWASLNLVWKAREIQSSSFWR